MDNKRSYIQGVVSGASIMLLACAIIFALTFQHVQPAANAEAINSKDKTYESILQVVSDPDVLKKLKTLAKMLDEEYYDEIDLEKIEAYLYKGVVAGLGDPYSAYYTKEEMKQVEESISGVYYGVGITMSLNKENNLAEVLKVAPNSPAEQAGVQVGDLISEVEDQSVVDMELSSIAALIRGEEGSTVNVCFLRNGTYLDLTLTRANIETETVTSEMIDGTIGYIRLEGFEEVTTKQFTESFDALKEQGMKGLILDLRDNPGGRVDVANEIAQYLIPEGTLTYIEDKYGNRQDFFCNGQKTWNQPLILLVNGNSASASEIIAGAVKDYQVGDLIGTTTFGKGIVQTTKTLNDGSALKYTFAKYYTPKGEYIHNKGIDPDLEIELDEINLEQGYSKDTDNQLKTAVEQMKQKIEK